MTLNAIKMTHILQNHLVTRLPKIRASSIKKLLGTSWPNSLNFIPIVHIKNISKQVCCDSGIKCICMSLEITFALPVNFLIIKINYSLVNRIGHTHLCDPRTDPINGSVI